MEYNCERRRLFRRGLIRELVSLTRVESALDTSGFLERGGGGVIEVGTDRESC